MSDPNLTYMSSNPPYAEQEDPYEKARIYDNAIQQEEEERNAVMADLAESPLGDSLESTPESSLTTFLAAFQTRGRYHLADLDLDEEYLSDFLTNFALRVDNIFQKYRAGQLEHGGDLRDRDLKRERSQEIDDLLVYDVVDNTCTGLKVTVRV